ncbi:MAG: DUF1730 domain-containing protein [Clostridia bacterium]|nr:DUF1730 domain-containing protein [Clostridia bacterium]
MREKIQAILQQNDIPLVGFCPFEWVQPHLLNCRAAARLPQNAKTVIICAFPYKVKEQPPQNISRYAAVPDYHLVFKELSARVTEQLCAAFPENRFEWFQDNSPIPEVSTAATAGLGVRGDNGLLITKEYGSWVFLGEWVTDLALECENRFSACPHCGRCAAACPKSDECLSAVTQKKGELSSAEAALLRQHNLVWGCDICAEACPLNKNVKMDPIAAFADGYRDEYVIGEDITGRAYAWRGEKPVRRNAENLLGE